MPDDIEAKRARAAHARAVLKANEFKKGAPTANPAGRPVGSRNRLQGSFLNALANDFDKNGRAAIEHARRIDPMGYVKTIASLMPKQFEQTTPLEDLTDAELTAGIALLRGRLAGGLGEGNSAPGESQSIN
jgi:hypothetical protein